MRKYTLIVLGIIFSIAQSFSQTKITASTDSANTLIGSRIIVELKLEGKSDSKYIFPIISDTVNKLIVLDRSLIDTVINGNSIILKQKVYLTSFDSGEYIFPELTFFEQQQSGSMLMPLYSNQLDIKIKSIDISNMKDIADIKHIYEVKKSWLDYIHYSIYLIILLALLIISFLLYKNIKRNQSIIQLKA